MAAFDLDGTLLGLNHRISDNAVRYLRSLHAKSFLINLAAGRSATATAEAIRRLDLLLCSGPPAAPGAGLPVVCSNGARGMYVTYDPF